MARSINTSLTTLLQDDIYAGVSAIGVQLPLIVEMGAPIPRSNRSVVGDIEGRKPRVV